MVVRASPAFAFAVAVATVATVLYNQGHRASVSAWLRSGHSFIAAVSLS